MKYSSFCNFERFSKPPVPLPATTQEEPYYTSTIQKIEDPVLVSTGFERHIHPLNSVNTEAPKETPNWKVQENFQISPEPSGVEQVAPAAAVNPPGGALATPMMGPLKGDRVIGYHGNMYSSPTPSTKEDLMKELKGNDIFRRCSLHDSVGETYPEGKMMPAYGGDSTNMSLTSFGFSDIVNYAQPVLPPTSVPDLARNSQPGHGQIEVSHPNEAPLPNSHVHQFDHQRVPLMRQHSADAAVGSHPKEGHFQGHQQSLSFNLGQPSSRESIFGYQSQGDDNLRAITRQQQIMVLRQRHSTVNGSSEAIDELMNAFDLVENSLPGVIDSLVTDIVERLAGQTLDSSQTTVVLHAIVEQYRG
ncbi:hypothetical protein LSH36_237g03034 [Paralvinella palmiformis]|uniref:Uncharacterized protein n=1 Tax=Paralvinella palmiformis TaxID=53620 RepID=A0AAD9JLR3_9ANNE|nr:hypothetical protein LSH36_237g03034 [Paralvinella palmiformis]